MSDRDDPMVTAARAVLEVQQAALDFPGSRATVGRMTAVPGGANVIPSSVTMSLDARASSDEETRALVQTIAERVRATEFIQNSWSPEVHFDRTLAETVTRAIGDVPVLPSGAGHDAGVLAAAVPTAMIFVRNPDGVSHAPGEYAELDDCLAGIQALEDVVRSLV